MPVRNQARFVAEALKSIRIQRYTNYELLFVDTASEDGLGTLSGNTRSANRAFA